MIKPIQLVAIWDDRDNTEKVSAIVYGTKEDLKVFRGLLDEAGNDEVTYDGYSRYDIYCDLVTPIEKGVFQILDFDVDEELLEGTAVTVLYAFIAQFL